VDASLALLEACRGGGSPPTPTVHGVSVVPVATRARRRRASSSSCCSCRRGGGRCRTRLLARPVASSMFQSRDAISYAAQKMWLTRDLSIDTFTPRFCFSHFSLAAMRCLHAKTPYAQVDTSQGQVPSQMFTRYQTSGCDMLLTNHEFGSLVARIVSSDRRKISQPLRKLSLAIFFWPSFHGGVSSSFNALLRRRAKIVFELSWPELSARQWERVSKCDHGNWLPPTDAQHKSHNTHMYDSTYVVCQPASQRT